ASGHKTAQKLEPATFQSRKTYDLLRELQAGGQVTLLAETRGWAYIKAGSAEFKVPCLPAEEYPALPPVEEAEFSSLDSEIFEEMIRQTIFATSHDETRYTLSGVLMVCDSKELMMVATDGHRLAHTRRPVPFGRDLRVIVPRKALEEVSRFAADSEEKT